VDWDKKDGLFWASKKKKILHKRKRKDGKKKENEKRPNSMIGKKNTEPAAD